MDNSKADKTKKDASGPLEARKAEATSKETLTDVRRDEKNSDLKTSGDQASVPSPDGTPEPDRGSGRADGSDTGGPM